MIYAIEAWGTGFIKFGKANSVSKRLKELEVGCPFQLHIVAAAPWPDGAETAIHSYLAPDIERGEWYQEGVRADEVLGWMNHKDSSYGLERLRLATGRTIEEGSSPPRRLLSRTREKSLSKVERKTAAETRRAERKAWWDAQESVASAQQTQCTIAPEAVS